MFQQISADEEAMHAPLRMLRTTVNVRSPYGDKMELECVDEGYGSIKLAIEEALPGITVHTMWQMEGALLQADECVDVSKDVRFSYLLGAGMGCSIVRSFPEMARLRILCWKCGLQNFPDCEHDWWCVDRCCCLHRECGMKELWRTQICCIVCCEALSNFRIETKCPDVLTISILCFTCGVTNFPNLTKDDWCSDFCCCLFQECGPRDCNVQQIFCCKLAL